MTHWLHEFNDFSRFFFFQKIIITQAIVLKLEFVVNFVVLEKKKLSLQTLCLALVLPLFYCCIFFFFCFFCINLLFFVSLFLFLFLFLLWFFVHSKFYRSSNGLLDTVIYKFCWCLCDLLQWKQQSFTETLLH